MGFKGYPSHWYRLNTRIIHLLTSKVYAEVKGRSGKRLFYLLFIFYYKPPDTAHIGDFIPGYTTNVTIKRTRTNMPWTGETYPGGTGTRDLLFGRRGRYSAATEAGKMFPCRESNPGLLGESQISCSILTTNVSNLTFQRMPKSVLQFIDPYF